jgi:hypothetical protein
MSTEKQKDMSKSILDNVNNLIGQMVTVQDFTHKSVLLEAARYVFIYKDTTIIEKVLNNITGVKGSFRVETLAYWFQHVAGISIEYNEKLGWHKSHLAKDSYPSNHGVPFTYDKAHLVYCKSEALRFWKIAPVTIKELKIGELEKMTSSAEIQLARGISVGVLTEEEVQNYLSDMFKRVQEAINSKAVKKWTGEYFAQQPKVKDEVEEELAELLNADLLEE